MLFFWQIMQITSKILNIVKKVSQKNSHIDPVNSIMCHSRCQWMSKISKVVGGDLLDVRLCQSQWCIHMPITDLISCDNAWIIRLLNAILNPYGLRFAFPLPRERNVKSIHQLNKTAIPSFDRLSFRLLVDFL